MSALAVMPTFMRSAHELEITQDAIKSFYATTAGVPLMIVDDFSPYKEGVQTLSEMVATEFPGLHVYAKPENEGFAKTVNIGLRAARDEGQDALLVNADIEFRWPGWFEAMSARDESVVGALLLYPNGLVQHAGIFFSLISRQFDHIHKFAPGNLSLVHQPRHCPVTGALQLIRNECLREVGLYDEDFRLGWEDVDYCHRVFQSGRSCMYEPKAQAVHRESVFRGHGVSEKILRWQKGSWKHLHEKWAGHDFSQYTPTLLWDDEPVIQ